MGFFIVAGFDGGDIARDDTLLVVDGVEILLEGRAEVTGCFLIDGALGVGHYIDLEAGDNGHDDTNADGGGQDGAKVFLIEKIVDIYVAKTSCYRDNDDNDWNDQCEGGEYEPVVEGRFHDERLDLRFGRQGLGGGHGRRASSERQGFVFEGGELGLFLGHGLVADEILSCDQLVVEWGSYPG